MYELFRKVGTPLPKDPNLIDYGFKFTDDFQEKQNIAREEADQMRIAAIAKKKQIDGEDKMDEDG